jgi:UV DNA damage endonuclease
MNIMRITLGYVSIALNLPNVTSSSPVTYTNYQKLTTKEQKLDKLKKVTLSNLDDLYKILQYNINHQIHFYRITSALVPLATHPEVINWDYRKIFKKDFERLGNLIKENNMRVDTHPDEFNVINSIKEEVVHNSIRNLLTHVQLFEDLSYPKGKMVLHIGSAQGGTNEAMKRFINNLKTFPLEITEKLMLENDDKTFTAAEVLRICNEIRVPMVLDVHHHICNNQGENLDTMLPYIFSTWDNQLIPPKIHFSTPRESEKDRKHADYINAVDFCEFVEHSKSLNEDYYVMIEAKKKDQALFKLAEDIKAIRPGWKWIDNSTFEL